MAVQASRGYMQPDPFFTQQQLNQNHLCRAHSNGVMMDQDECSQDVEELRQQLDEACGTIANLQDENDHLTALIPELEERIKSTEVQVRFAIPPMPFVLLTRQT